MNDDQMTITKEMQESFHCEVAIEGFFAYEFMGRNDNRKFRIEEDRNIPAQTVKLMKINHQGIMQEIDMTIADFDLILDRMRKDPLNNNER